MKVLTLTQPHASLMAIGAKRFETRSWRSSYRGPLGIHAAMGFPGDAAILCEQEPFRSALNRSWKELPLGQILAVVDLVDCIPTDGTFIPHLLWETHWGATHEMAFGDYSNQPKQRYAWLTRHVRRLARPITVKGHLSLWEHPTAEIEAALR